MQDRGFTARPMPYGDSIGFIHSQEEMAGLREL
jgi:hypothetical protein